METVADLLGNAPRAKVAQPKQVPQPQNVWVNYDNETDSFIFYLTGEPVRGVHVWLKDDTYVIVDPTTREMVGMYVEDWERSFVPAHPDVEDMWRVLKPSLVPEKGWSQSLRAVALWIVMLFWQMQQVNDSRQSMQPV